MLTSPNTEPNLRRALEEARNLLAAGAHAGRARRDAETLLLHALRQQAPQANLAWLIAHDGEMLAAEAATQFRALIERRLAGEPIQYITGEAEFYGLPFQVNRDVLIPRPETELVVEKVIALARRHGQSSAATEARIVDVGTGSGAIAVALAHALPRAHITAVDLSAAALGVAKANAERHGVGNRIRFVAGDLLAPAAAEQFDFVVSNPPYVPEGDRATLDAEVRDYEPAQALFAGQDGLAVYRRLLPQAFNALAPGGWVLLEIGYGQQEPIGALLAGEGFAGIVFSRDLQGIARVAMAARR